MEFSIVCVFHCLRASGPRGGYCSLENRADMDLIKLCLFLTVSKNSWWCQPSSPQSPFVKQVITHIWSHIVLCSISWEEKKLLAQQVWMWKLLFRAARIPSQLSSLAVKDMTHTACNPHRAVHAAQNINMTHCKIWHTAHRTLFGLALGLAAKDMTPSAHSEACNQLLTVFHISYHLICSKTTFYDHPGKTVGGREVVKWSCSRPNTFPSLCIVLVWIHLHEKHPHTKPTVLY